MTHVLSNCNPHQHNKGTGSKRGSLLKTLRYLLKTNSSKDNTGDSTGYDNPNAVKGRSLEGVGSYCAFSRKPRRAVR